MVTELMPRFTVTLRGYDKDEVDEYLESLATHATDADGELLAHRQRQRELESEVQRLGGRVRELEQAIRTESPHTVRAIGERITLILSEAEAGASETLAHAHSRAEQLVAEARNEAEDLRQQATTELAEARQTREEAERAAEEQLQRAEAEAKARASAILNEAEARARRRQAQIEGWAQEVIAATQADQAQMAEEFALLRRRHESELVELTTRRDDVVSSLRSLQQSIARAVDRIPWQPSGDTGGVEAPGTHPERAGEEAAAPSGPFDVEEVGGDPDLDGSDLDGLVHDDQGCYRAG
ncbi:MAG: DivIVA domain-containing protein [Actinomycetota bacterium]|nr:DivIVA domain-containing protein [Actinomycetota bacterium]